MMTRTYRLIEKWSANEITRGGRIVHTETITETPGGLTVTTHVTGNDDHGYVDHRSETVYPGGSMAAAHAYRMSHGYTELCGR